MQLPTNLPLKHRRNALVTGIATLAVAGTATLALALPQDTSTAAAAAAAAPAPTAAAAPAATIAQQLAAAQAQAAGGSDPAKAQADADAKAAADAKAKADADAKAKADAEAKAAADARAKADADAKAKAQAASRSQQRQALRPAAPTGTPQQIAAQLVPAGQLGCFSNIVFHESSWNVHAVNRSSGAYGLVQALPASKLASAGADWRDSAATQIKWGLNYMNSRYGSPCGAWSFWQAHHWY
jgi:hypothetical protein